MVITEGNPQSGAPIGPSKDSGAAKSRIVVWIVLILILLAIPTYFIVRRIDQMNRRMLQLRQQVEESNRAAGEAAEKSNSALTRAMQAEQNAQQAASERDQALQAKAASDQAAKEAQQQAQTAQQQATAAQAKAAEYRKEREAELAHLQQVLNQIADTRRTAMGLVMTLGSNSIRFDFDKASLRPEDKQVLSRIAGVLSTVEGYQIYVYGYTDHIGTKEYNQQLSERRAKSVRDYLVANGLNPNIISTKGFGESDPLVPGTTPKARAINRRVEIGLVDSTIKPAPPENQ